jgi:tripartite-type tricarboxylate transporter receptor subunit TctC
MNLARRQVLLLSAGASALPILSPAANADTFPPRPVHIVVGFPPGGVGDVAARLIVQSLQPRFDQTVIVDNRPGAGGNLGTQAVAEAPPDGCTLVLASSKDTINATLYKHLPFDFIRDIAMVAGIMQSPLVMVINAAFPAKNVAEFISYARANPDKINMASGGNGTVSHLAGELFQMMAGVSMVHVPYRGDAAALADLIAGRVQVMFPNVATSNGFIRDQRLQALAVTSLKASPILTGIPPLTSVVPGYDVSPWFGIGAPKATPAAAVTALNQAINAALAEPAIVSRIHQLGGEPFILRPSECDAFVAADAARWAKAVKFSGAKVD